MPRFPARLGRHLLPLSALLAACTVFGTDPPIDPDRALVLDGTGWVVFDDRDDRFDLVEGGERTFALWLRYTRPQYHAKILFKMTPPDGSHWGFSTFVHQYSSSLGFWHRITEPLDETGFPQAGTAGTRRVPASPGRGGQQQFDGWVRDLSRSVDFLEGPQRQAGCSGVRNALRRADGDRSPPDVVAGPARDAIAAELVAILAEEGCQG